MTADGRAAPVGKKFFTPGMMVVIGTMLGGVGWGLYRMLFGLASTTNLNDQYPMGLWIGVDVASGVALAAGGFTTSALVYVMRREHFHAVVRPALLTAMLGYTFVAIGLLFDLGRWYNIWHPTLPWMWQGNSVLFEVGMCVMLYLTVLYLEFVPIVCERFMGRVHLPGKLARLDDLVDIVLRLADHMLGKVMFLFIIAGVVLSCLHQSSLGTLMVIAPYKLHPLYWTPVLPLLFLTSAVAVGFPVVILESMLAARTFDRKPEMHVLTPLAGLASYLLGIYVAVRVGDMLYRGSYVFLLEGSPASIMFWIEFGLLTLVPWCMFMTPDIRRSPGGLLAAATMYIAGVMLNRCTVFFIAYNPPYAERAYVPAIGEFALTIGLMAAIVFAYRVFVTLFPVLPASEKEA
ncbi:MAG: NrfD/PsrC family molybdoenzyme membrane anchor subunit [Pirellulales bacterium]